MIRLKIDNRDVEIPDGSTVLDAAETLGIEIPTMCHLRGQQQFTSCMVCMVHDKTSDRLLPSCSALAGNGMDIVTDSDKVIESRKMAIELLLSDHVGDCEAPCHRVCPAGINIPRLIRHIIEGQVDMAAAEVVTATGQSSNPCIDCKMPCEKACRRRQHDNSVSISLLVKYALDESSAAAKDSVNKGETAVSEKKIFNCNMGKLLEGEMNTFLENASTNPRTEPANGQAEGFTEHEAVNEAKRCLHCDCRKQDSCKLRNYATVYDAQQRRYSITGRKPFRQIRQHTEVVYEPEKCIKCGLCVRITEQDADELGLTFIGRGFDVQVGVPLNKTLETALKKTSSACVKACPTAALAFK